MRRALWSLAAAVVAVPALLAAAWGLGADLPVVGRRTVPGLTGVDWRIVAFETGGERWDGPAALDTTVRFESRRVTGRVCNHFGGGAVFHRDTIAVGTVLSTAQSCDGDLGRAGGMIGLVLFPHGSTGWTLTGDVLRLTGSGVTAELRHRP